jgi:hypothetical protein
MGAAAQLEQSTLTEQPLCSILADTVHEINLTRRQTLEYGRQIHRPR